MSATGRGAQRVANDFYPTPAWALRRLLDTHVFDFPDALGEWLEPCAGNGALIQATEEHFNTVQHTAPGYPHWTANELRPEAHPYLQQTLAVARSYIGDFRACPPPVTCDHPQYGPYQVILTNPSFALTMEIIEWALPRTRHLVLLQRLNYLETPARQPFFTEYMPDVYVLPNRPSFSLNKEGKLGTDATAYAWFHWPTDEIRDGRTGKIQVLGLTPDAELQEARAVQRAWYRQLGLLKE
jgi:hypothetical protein